MTFEGIIGQERAVRLLTRMLEKDRLPHALLFTGIDGVGRHTTAEALAQALNCLKPVGVSACQKCRSCQKMNSGNHPNVVNIKPTGVFIKIDQVRSLRKHLKFAPFENGRRVIIINDAHTMNAEASNAILKILEEPPDNTHIILIASQVTDLLPTIVSRCQKIPFRPIPVIDIAKVLSDRADVYQDAVTAMAVLAKGSLGKALSAEPKKWIDWRKDLLDMIESISTAPIQALFTFAEALARDKDRLQDALDIIIIWFRDILMCKFHPEKVLNRDYMEAIKHKSEEFTVDNLFEKIMAVSAAQNHILRNANRRLTLEVMMMRFCAVGQRQRNG